MQDIRTRDQLLHGLIKASIQLGCELCFNLTRLATLISLASKRVFILGPSHHVYLDGCALSKCHEYETPVGNLPLDLDSGSDIIISHIRLTVHSSQGIESHWTIQ